MNEREIAEPAQLCLPNGRLNPDAVGWTRKPLHNTDRVGRGAYAWGRNKRWEYWAITTPTHFLAASGLLEPRRLRIRCWRAMDKYDIKVALKAQDDPETAG